MAQAVSTKKGENVVILEVGSLIGITDYFVICSGRTERQVAAIQEEVERRLRRSGIKPDRREGEREQRWILLDYLDVVVHIFHQEEREYYELERLWQDAPRVVFESGKEVVGDGASV